MPERAFPMPSLDSLIQGERPICYGVLKPGIEDDHGVPLIRIVDMDSGGLRPEGLFRISPALDKEFARSRIDSGDLLLSIQGTVGRVAIAPPELAGANISRTIARLSFATAGDGRFYKHWFLSSDGLRAIDGAIVGTTRSSLNIGVLRKVAVPSPTGPEKSTIADILDTLDTTIRQTEAIIEKLRQVKQGLLHDLLTRGIDANGELRPPQSQAPHLYKNSPLGWIPREWEFAHLGQLSRPRQWPTISQGQLMAFGYPVFGANGQIGYFHRYTHEHPTIAVTCRGATCGNVHLTPSRCYITGNAMALDDLDAERVQVEFLANFLRDRGMADCTTGSAQPQIIASEIRRVCVALPLMHEQALAVQLLAAEDARISAERSALHKLAALKSGLMDDLLTGRVRVTPLLA